MKKPDLSYVGKMRKLFNYRGDSGLNKKAAPGTCSPFPWTQV